jgi:Undecaprenyl-phosphate glucose phosphotransferase
VRASSPRANWADLMPHNNAALVRSAFVVAAVLFDGLAIMLAAVLAGIAYHDYAFGENDVREAYFAMGLFVSAMFVMPNCVRGEYSLLNYLDIREHAGRSIGLWNVAFASAILFAFLTKTTSDFSRVTAIVFYPLGFGLVMGARWALVTWVRKEAEAGRVSARRVFLVGHETDMKDFSERHQPWISGVRIVTAVVLRGEEDLTTDLALAAASARMMRPDDIFILVSWSDTRTIEACVNAFLRVPASIHLGPERVLGRFVDARISRFGAISSLNLVGHPLSVADVLLKRAFDVVVASLALIASAPLMIVLAIAIKLDSPGPVFFRQRRYGFNQEPFEIVKFRSMITMDNGREIIQARANDPRVTRVGRFMRRLNFDELPQLFDVLRGKMSLVGPRPHALAHDQKYESMIALYARRHNMKPGITGWAQVNGFRGETIAADSMRQRVEHDLWYIDNWSLWLDMRILVLTITSAKAYRNAV